MGKSTMLTGVAKGDGRLNLTHQAPSRFLGVKPTLP